MPRNRRRNYDVGKGSKCDYVVYIDGICIYSPGGPGGYGIVIVDTETGEINEYSGGYPATTNNRIELTSIIEGLRRIPAQKSAMVYSGSRYALGILTGSYIPAKNRDLVERLNEAASGKHICTSWVRNRSETLFHERCSSLASDAAHNPTAEDPAFCGKAIGQHAPYKDGYAITLKIAIPEDIERFYSCPEKYKVKERCAEAIQRLNENDLFDFKDFLELKTGGVDGWSHIDVEKEFPESVKKFVSGFFPLDINTRNCLKWYGRGLALDLAIRKELVSMETAYAAKNWQKNAS